MVTGSSVANTVSSGSFTIPMMKRAGFKPEFSAAAEASASTGGQIMPPIMGAAAFIMAEYTGVPYSEIILVAIVPAMLYFSGVFMGTHFQAKKQGIYGLPKSELPSFKGILKRMDLIAPLVAIVALLLMGYTATFAAMSGIVTAFVVSLFRKDTRMSLRDLLWAFEKGARIALLSLLRVPQPGSSWASLPSQDWAVNLQALSWIWLQGISSYYCSIQ